MRTLGWCAAVEVGKNGDCISFFNSTERGTAVVGQPGKKTPPGGGAMVT